MLCGITPRPGLVLRWQRSSSSFRRSQVKCFAGESGVAVKFVIPYRCRFGQHLCLVGSVEQLGSWDVSKGLEMVWSDGDLWRAEVDIAPSVNPDVEQEVEYKYVVRNGDRHSAEAWTPGHNYIIKLPAVPSGVKPGAARLHVRDTWDGTGHTVKVHLPDLPPPPAAAGQQAAAQDRPSVAATAVAAPAAALGAPPAFAAAAPAPSPPFVAAPAPAPAPPPPAAAAATPIAKPAPMPQQLQPPSPEAEQEPRPKRRGRPRKASPDSSSSDSESVALAAISRESERAMQQLDAAITSSWELLEGMPDDPANPQLLAADRLLAAASQRAAVMAKALDAAKAQRLLGDGSGGGGGPSGSAGGEGKKARRVRGEAGGDQ